MTKKRSKHKNNVQNRESKEKISIKLSKRTLKTFLLFIIIAVVVLGNFLYLQPKVKDKAYNEGFQQGVVQLALRQTATGNITILVQNEQGEVQLEQDNFSLQEYGLTELIAQFYQQSVPQN